MHMMLQNHIKMSQLLNIASSTMPSAKYKILANSKVQMEITQMRQKQNFSMQLGMAKTLCTNEG